MSTAEVAPTIPAGLKVELQQALEALANGVRDPASARKAAERMDRLREENRRRLGEQDCAVTIVRQMRAGR